MALWLAAALAGFGAYLVGQESFTWLFVAVVAVPLAVAALPHRRWRVWVTAGLAACLAAVAVWESAADLADGVLFWWPAGLAVVAAFRGRRRAR